MRRDFALVRRLTTLTRDGGAVGRASRNVAGVAMATVACAMLTGCTVAQRSGQASSYFIINSMQGASGATPDKLSNTLASDVVTNVKRKVGNEEVLSPTIYEDKGQVEFSLALKNPGPTDAPSTPSTTNFITVTRYHVNYVRSDGRNTPGVDVPYPFDGAATATVTNDGAVMSVVLVRIQAKEEAPLMQLRGGGGAITISTIAEVTFYGTDQAGREVSGTGRISINFADWGDPQ